MNQQANTLFLINPQANEKEALKVWERKKKKLPLLPTPIDLTTIPVLSDFIKEKNPRLIIIGGGDGTINVVCNAILEIKHKPTLAILPLGFGNALSSSLGVETLEKAYDVIAHQPLSVAIDLFHTSLSDMPIGVFTMGVGLDGQIVHARTFFRYIGLRSYTVSVIRSFFEHRNKPMIITIDHDVQLTATVSSLVLTNAPTLGKHFLLAEHAKLNDGFLDGIIFSSHYAYLTNLRLRGFKHPLYSEENKVFFKAKHLRIDGEPFAQIDGEALQLKQALEIQVLPKAVTFLRNIDKKIILPEIPFV
jgi:diacylglycerol kinase (ATP)